MGLSYSFFFITQQSNTLPLLSAFSTSLSPRDQARFEGMQAYEPEEKATIGISWDQKIKVKLGIKFPGVKPSDEATNSYCFSFFVDLAQDAHIQAYQNHYNQPSHWHQEKQKIRVGCVYTNLFVGEKATVLEATAATSEMSRLFVNSKNMHALCASIAQTAGNTVIFLDQEDYRYWWRLYPYEEMIFKPDIDLFAHYTDKSILNADAFVLEAERLAGHGFW